MHQEKYYFYVCFKTFPNNQEGEHLNCFMMQKVHLKKKKKSPGKYPKEEKNELVSLK